MACPQCGNETIPGAAFCGNCGQALLSDVMALVASPVAPATTDSPSTEGTPGAQFSAVTLAANEQSLPLVPSTAHGSRKAVAALVLGVMGLVGWLVPILGLAIGVAAIIFGTTAYRSPRKHLAMAGTVLGCIGVVLALGAWVYYFQAAKKDMPLASSSRPAASQAIETLCYGTSAEKSLQAINNSVATCLFDANDLATGDEYTIKSLKIDGLTSTNLASVSKVDIDNLAKLYPGLTLESSQAINFADSPAHQYRLGNISGQTATIMYVLHESSSGYNLFIVAHFSTSAKTSLEIIERNWQWK